MSLRQRWYDTGFGGWACGMEPIEKLFIVMAVIGLVGLVSTVVYLLAR